MQCLFSSINDLIKLNRYIAFLLISSVIADNVISNSTVNKHLAILCFTHHFT